MIRAKLAALCIGGLLNAPAFAAFVESGFQGAPGDVINYDTETNLSWLDMSYTLGWNYNDVNSFIASNTELGFRLANQSEVFTLFDDALMRLSPEEHNEALAGTAINTTYSWSSTQGGSGYSDYTYAQSIFPSLMETFGNASGFRFDILRGRYALPNAVATKDDYVRLGLAGFSYEQPSFQSPTTEMQIAFGDFGSEYLTTRSDNTFGWYVVSGEQATTSVSEPTMLSLSALGISALMLLRRRKKSHKNI